MYNEFYGFSEQPFDITPDLKFLFLTESHREALASMTYGIYERKGFISIAGEVGTGKTTIIHQLLDNLDRRVKVVFISQTKATFDQLLREVLLELELPVGDQNTLSLTRQFNHYLIERLGRDENLAIIIDEAQHLSMEALEELRLLSNLETATAKLLQIVLVGQPELEDKLNSRELRQLKQRIVIRRRILPLREEDCRRYIEHRLKKVGSSISQVFTADALSMICHYSKGIPRTINILCDNAFLIGHGRGSKKINPLIIQEVISHMEALPPRESVEGITGYQKKIRSRSPRFKTLAPRISYTAMALFILVLGMLLGRGQVGSVQENLRLEPSVQQPADEQKIFASPLETNGANTPQAPPTLTEEVKTATPPPLSPSPVSPVVQAQPKPETGVTIATIEEGVTMHLLSQKYYRTSNLSMIDHILEFNPKITNPNLIKINEKIKIPEFSEESLITQAPDETYRVHLATFLQPESAERYKKEPALQGKEIEVTPRKFSGGEIWYRVVAGKFASREESLKTIQALKANGLLPHFQ
jgi:type II secretory pathway predicted ATPase ExeA/cell division protein FtsN